MTAMIKVDQVSKRYAGSEALKEVSFEIGKGEIVGFLGPNGAGKTTMMRIITGYLPASDGRVEVGGWTVRENPLEVRKRIGYLPEYVPLYRDMSVIAYLNYMGNLKGFRGEENKDAVDKAIDMCMLGEVRDRLIEKLSRGFCQRVGLAQALLGEPEVLILDEPTIGLDPNQIASMRSLIRNLGREKTILLSTHILSEVNVTCERVLIIDKGELVARGKPEELEKELGQGASMTVSVDVLVKGPQEGLEDYLKEKIKGLEEVRNISAPRQGYASFSLQGKEGKDIRSRVAETVVKSKKWDLLELKPTVLGLEEVFRKLTTMEGEQK